MDGVKTPRVLVDWRDIGRHRPCIWQLCSKDASDRYQVPLCQEHTLLIWAMVEQDRCESGLDYDPDELLTQSARPRPAVEVGWIYYLQVGDYLKIGFTRNLHQRISQYPPNAELLATHHGTLDDEQRLHGRFRAYLDSGREWYADADEIRDHIARVLIEHGAPESPVRRVTQRRQPLRPKSQGHKI